MSKTLKFALPALVVVVAGFFLLQRESTPKMGSRFPSLDTFELEGKLPELSGKVVLVDFWASWCGPCQKAFPTLQKLHQTYESKGFTVLGVSLDEKKEAMDEFVKKSGATFPIVRDGSGKSAEALSVSSVPTTFLVGTDGRIRAIHEGFEGPDAEKQIAGEIEAALGGGQP